MKVTQALISVSDKRGAVDAAGPDFLNAVAELSTGLGAQELLAELHAIEQRHGRVRSSRNAPRTLDLELLFVNHWVLVKPLLFLVLEHIQVVRILQPRLAWI